MSWTILVRINEEHNEYWSAELAENRRSYTGRVLYGGIGQRGREHNYDGDSEVVYKIQDKLRNGYRIVAQESADYVPSREMLENVSRGPSSARIVERHRAPREEPKPRVNDRVEIRQESPVRRVEERIQRIRHVSSTGISTYKTSRDGLIKKYNPNYVRQTPQSRQSVRPYTFYGKDQIRTSETLKEKSKKFYNSIQESMCIRKPAFGFGENDIFGIHTGKFVFAFDKNNKPVSVFEIRANGLSEFLYIKTIERNYVTLLKEVLKEMMFRRPITEYTIRIKSDTLMNAIKEIITHARITTSGEIHTINFLKRNAQFVDEGMDSEITDKDRWQDL